MASLQALLGTGSLRMFVQGSRKGCHCCAGARGDAAGAVGHGQPAHICSRVSKRVPLLRRSAWRRCRRCRARAACACLFKGLEKGATAAQERVATLQSLSGTGSLRVGAEFISKFLPGRTVYLSNPTWCALAVLQVDA